MRIGSQLEDDTQALRFLAGLMAGMIHGGIFFGIYYTLQARDDRKQLLGLTTSTQETIESVNAATVAVEQAIENMAQETSRVQKQAIWIGVSAAILGSILGAIAGAYAGQLVG